MIGRIDPRGRALIRVPLRPATNAPFTEIEVWIDTGFTGELVLPQALIEQLNLAPAAYVKARLADGSEVALPSYVCTVQWFGELEEIEIIAGTGEYPLLGVGLLHPHRIVLDYRSGSIQID